MPTVHFLGRVEPRWPPFSILNPPTMGYQENDGTLKAICWVHIEDSVVDVECKFDEFDETNLHPLLFHRALDLAQVTVNLVSFATGRGFMVILDTFVFPDGRKAQVDFTDDGLGKLVTAFRMDDHSFEEVYRIVMSENALILTLNDVIAMGTTRYISAINCARVIDSIRRMIAPSQNEKAGWFMMQSVLNISRSYQEHISKLSVAPRHGDRSPIPIPVTMDLVTRTWIIMNRFLEFRKRGNQPLPLSDFPLLS